MNQFEGEKGQSEEAKMDVLRGNPVILFCSESIVTLFCRLCIKPTTSADSERVTKSRVMKSTLRCEIISQTQLYV